MADVTLKLTTDSNQAVKGIQDTQKAAANLDKQMKDLFMANKKGFSDVEKIKAYEKQMDELKKKFAEVTAEQKKLIDTQQASIKKTDEFGEAAGGLAKKLGPVALALSAITLVARAVVQAFKDTVFGLNAMTIAGELWTTMAYNIATANFNMGKSFALAIGTGKMINEQRKKDREELIISSKLRTEYNKLYFEASDRTQTNQKQLDKLNKSLKTHNDLIDIELKNAKDHLAIVEVQLIQKPKSNKLLNEEAKLLAQINTIEGQRYSETKRVEQRRTSLENTIREDNMTKYINWIEERLKAQDEFQALSLQLQDKYDKSQIESLEGKPKLEAIRKFGIEQIKELRNQIASLGPLSDEQERMLQTMADNVWKQYYKDFAAEAKKVRATPEQQKAISEALLGNIDELPGLQKMTQNTVENINQQLGANAMIEDFSIWKLLGIDIESDEGQKQIDAIKELASTISGILEDSLDQRVEIAERERELLDTQISQLQNEIDLEAELMEEGYANNLDAKKRELEGLKKQREQALKEEEEALKRQRAFERISQAVSLASSVANILKEFTALGPLGLGLATGAIGILFTIWQAAKTKAAESTALAEGGSGSETGMITGRRHSQGGERFLDHVEVERGEAWGVLSAPASEKYGEVFHQMISSFNKNEMPDIVSSPIIHNPVTVENSGPNSRLDKVIKINEALLKQSHQYNVGNKRIISSGNKVRIVG